MSRSMMKKKDILSIQSKELQEEYKQRRILVKALDSDDSLDMILSEDTKIDKLDDH